MVAAPSEQQRSTYQLAFVRNCLTLVLRAHRSMDTHSFAASEEPRITGELIRTAKILLEDPDAEPWMEHLDVLDDPPQNVSGRFGKQRPRIDIEFVTVVRGKRPRFLIEAKRLYRSDSVSQYYGTGGLLMFVNGQYGAEWPSAGMLGYVQTTTCTDWLVRLAAGLAEHQTELLLVNKEWEPVIWSDEGLKTVRVSGHRRSQQGLDEIEIFHLLLDFTRSRVPPLRS
jgi:hypothetical protein